MWTIKPIYENGIHLPDIASPHFHCLAKQGLNDPDPSKFVTNGVMHPTIQFTNPSLPFFRYPNVHIKANWVGGKQEPIWDAIYKVPPRTSHSNLLPKIGLTWSSLDWKANMTKNILRPGGSDFVHMKTICAPPDNILRRILITATPADSDKQDVLGGTVGVAVYDVKNGTSSASALLADSSEPKRRARRVNRVEAFLKQGMVEPFRNRPERAYETVIRICSWSIGFLKSAVSVVPFTGILNQYVSGLYYLVHYGPLWLSSSDLIEAIGLILKLVQAAELDHPSLLRLAFSDLPFRLYYAMAENRGARVNNAHLEHQEFLSHSKGPIPIASLKDLEKFCSLAVSVGYVSNPVDAQRLLWLQGYTLLVHQRKERVFLLACNKTEALLVLPGTQGLGDVTVDVNAFESEVCFPLSGISGKAHRGILTEAKNMEEEVGRYLIMLSERGYKIRISGHSLGAGIGAVLTGLLSDRIKDIHSFGFGSPPCVSGQLAQWLEDKCTNVVLRDDVVCRATTGNIDKLLSKILAKDTSDRFKTYMRDDMRDLKNLREIIRLKRRVDVPSVSSVGVVSEVKNPTGFESKALDKLRNLFIWPFSRYTKAIQSISLQQEEEGFLIPGKIAHIYKTAADRYAAGYISRSAKTLNRIELQPEMLYDHFGENYVRALRECLIGGGSIFTERHSNGEICACCKSDFLLDSILKNKIHSFLAKRICGRCGSHVCTACIKRERVEPGRLSPVKVCEKCWLIPPFPPLTSKL